MTNKTIVTLVILVMVFASVWYFGYYSKKPVTT